MKKIFIAILFVLLSFSISYAEYFQDIIVTGPNGAWMDARAYSSLSDAVTAAGVNQRTIHIYTSQSCTNLIVGSNITLHFGRDGSINNSGTLTLQTRNIIAPDRQIFTGSGQIDFVAGTEVRSAWFQNFETAIALTSNDSVTLVVTKPQTLTASFAVGNNVHLKWETPNNVITVNAGVTLSNVRNIYAGNYQILAGSGTVSFYSGIEVALEWFTNLRTIITWLGATPATIGVHRDNIVDYTDTSLSTTNIILYPGSSLSMSATKTLTVSGLIINSGNITGLGSLIVSNTGKVINNEKISTSTLTLSGKYSGIGEIDVSGAISIPGSFDVPYDIQVFTGAGTVTGLSTARPEWWGTDQAALEAALNSLL